ncbi:hypothetical protein [Rhizohabitans arisaemae]|nr:hypothetical protein [Rhizohabitans arisaemae]
MPGPTLLVLGDRVGTAAFYRINDACVDCFPAPPTWSWAAPRPRLPAS